jgi:hypothetical protein
MRAQKIIKRFKGPLLIFAIIVFANILFLAGTFKNNPIDQFSGAVTFTHVGLYGVYATIDPNNAYGVQALGHAAVDQILHGHMPWWNYNEQVGAPLAGGMQSAALFLPFNLLLALSTGVLYFHIVLQLVGGIATYYLLRKLKCSDLASIVGGSLFALNGTFAWFTSANVNPIAFLPLLILGIEIALEHTKTKKKGGWILIALALAFSLYSGFPEGAFLDGILALVWLIVRTAQLRHGDWLKFSKKVILGGFTGLLLAAPILVAFFDFLPYANVGAHTGTGGLSVYHLPPSALPALVMPYVYGPIFQFVSYDHTGTIQQFWANVGGYLTLPVIFLAFIGLFSHARKNRAIAYMLGIFSLVVIARNYGFPGTTEIINLIPGMNMVAFYRYVNPTVELAIIILAMIGLDSLLSKKKANKVPSKKVIWAGLIVFAIVLCLAPVAWGVVDQLYLAPHHRLWMALSVAWGLGGVASMLICIFFFKKYLKFLLPLIILVDALVMFIAPQLSAPRSTVVDLKPVNFLQANLGNSRFYSIGYIMPNYGSYYGIASINTNNEPISKSWHTYIKKQLNPNVQPSQMFTGIDMLDPKGITPLEAFFANMPAYENVSVKYVAIRNTLVTPDVAQQHSLKLVYSDDFYTIYQLPNTKPFFEATDGSCTVISSTTYSAETNCPKPSQLIRRELYMPGWTAHANGKAVSGVAKSDGLFQQIAVPKGRSTIKFNYTPPYIYLTYVAFGVGVVLIGYSAGRKLIDKSK